MLFQVLLLLFFCLMSDFIDKDSNLFHGFINAILHYSLGFILQKTPSNK